MRVAPSLDARVCQKEMPRSARKRHFSAPSQWHKIRFGYQGIIFNEKILNISMNRCASPITHTLIIIQGSWDLTRSSEILQDLLRSHKIYWFDISIGMISKSHFHFYTILSSFYTVTGTDTNCTGTDVTGRMVLLLKVLAALAQMLMTLTQSYLIFTDRFWGYLQFQKNEWLTHRTI